MARCLPFMAPHLAPTVSRPGDAPTGRVDRSQTSVRHLRGRSTYVGEISPISVFKSPLRTQKPARFPQNRHRLNTRWAAALHSRPGHRPRSRLLSGRQP